MSFRHEFSFPISLRWRAVFKKNEKIKYWHMLGKSSSTLVPVPDFHHVIMYGKNSLKNHIL